MADERQTIILNRIKQFNLHTGIPVERIISIKLRPTNQGLPDQDKTTYLPPDLYGNPNELHDIDERLMDDIGPQTSAPMKAIKWFGPNRDLLWVPHETGLEYLADVTTIVGGVVGGVASLIVIYEFFRKQWLAWSQRSSLLDRQQVTQMSIETRWVDSTGTLLEKVVLTKTVQQQFLPTDQSVLQSFIKDGSYKK